MSVKKQGTIPLVKLQSAEVTLKELIAQSKGRITGFRLPKTKGVLLVLPDEEFDFVASVIYARELLPTRLPKTPAEHFAEIVHILRRFERKYGMSSAEFYRRFQKGLLREGPADYWEWRVRYKSYLSMKERFGFSEAEVVDA